MRRSVREALVGFTLLAAVGSGLGLWMWLKGISIKGNNWTIRARFQDAAGLADRSPVQFRGVMVGHVRHIEVTDQAVIADLEITDPKLRLSRPVVARVGAGSLLGGDAVVSLLSAGRPLPEGTPGPRDRRCDKALLVCDRGEVKGAAAATLDTVTDTVQKMLDQADRDNLVPKLVAATASFDATAKETRRLTQDGQRFVKDARILVQRLNRSVEKVDPILANVHTASVDAARATRNVRNLTAALDNPRTVADLQATLANARRLTDRWQEVGGDVRKLTGDPKFMDGIRAVSVGLGRFFDELYPAQVEAARERERREQARVEGEKQRRRQIEERFAPRSRAPAVPPADPSQAP